MKTEELRRRLEAWLLRVWFDQTRGADRLLAWLLAPLLLPLSWLVATLARRRAAQIEHTATGRPAVVVVGNVVVGGSGKTPLVIALARALHERGLKVGLLARGYRASSDTPLLIDRNTPAAEAGDEALLLAIETGLPVGVGARRKAALDLLVSYHPDLDVVISDDGLQHVALPRRLELVMMHPLGLGNGRCLPAGPLREPAERLAHVDALLVPATSPQSASEGTSPDAFQPATVAVTPQAAAPQDCQYAKVLQQQASKGPRTSAPPRFGIRTELAGIRSLDGRQHWAPSDFVATMAGQRLAAVAGISRPERFFDSLRTLGLDITEYPLPDHAHIDPAWLATLPEPGVIMTAKDAVKCIGFPPALQTRCRVLDIRAVPDPALLEWLDQQLATTACCPSTPSSAH